MYFKEILFYNHITVIRSRKFYIGLGNSLIPKSIFLYCQLPPIISFVAVLFLVQDLCHISLILNELTVLREMKGDTLFTACFFFFACISISASSLKQNDRRFYITDIMQEILVLHALSVSTFFSRWISVQATIGSYYVLLYRHCCVLSPVLSFLLFKPVFLTCDSCYFIPLESFV